LLAVKFAISLLLRTAFLIFDRGGAKGAYMIRIKIPDALVRLSPVVAMFSLARLPPTEDVFCRIDCDPDGS
jgi:hypothetical protein